MMLYGLALAIFFVVCGVRIDSEGLSIAVIDRIWASRVPGPGLDSVVVFTRLPDDHGTPVPIFRDAGKDAVRDAHSAYASADSAAAVEARRIYPVRRAVRTLLSLCSKGAVALFGLDGRQLSPEEMRMVLPDRTRAVMDSLEVNSFALVGDNVYCTRVSVFRIHRESGRPEVALEGSNTGEWWSYYYGLRVSPSGRYLAINESNGTGHVVVYDLHRRRTTLRDQNDVEWFAWVENTDILATPDGHGRLTHGYELPSRSFGTIPPVDLPAQPASLCGTDKPASVIGFVGENVYIGCRSKILVYAARERSLRLLIDAGEPYMDAFAALQYVFQEP